MKAFFVVAVLALFVAVQAGLTEEQKAKAREHGKQCIEETGADAEEVKKLKSGEVVDNEKIQAFALCFYGKAGLVKDGEFQKDVAIEKLSEGIDKAKVTEIVEACAQSGTIDGKKALEIFTCAHKQGGPLAA